MERAPQNELNEKEMAMYNNFVISHPNTSPEAFAKMRKFALSQADAGLHDFFSVSGVIMEEMPTAEEMKESK